MVAENKKSKRLNKLLIDLFIDISQISITPYNVNVNRNFIVQSHTASVSTARSVLRVTIEQVRLE